MTDKAEFSLDISVDPATGLQPLPDLAALDLCKAYPAEGGKLLLYNVRTGQRAMVRPEVHAALGCCSQFKTLDEHVAQIIQIDPAMQGQQADILAVLKTMLDSGIMVSAKQACDNLKNSQPVQLASQGPDQPVVAIITWERPAALERLLKSIAVNCATDKIYRFYVIDDSRNPDNIGQNRELVAKYARALKTPLQYFGQSEQRSLQKALILKLPEHEKAIRFLADQSLWYDQWTSGLARNLALLLSCGRRLVMLDDDTICDVYQPCRQRSDITFSDSPRDADFFAREKEWASQHQSINPDPIDRHMQCLGMSFSQALTTLGKNNFKPGSLKDATALQLSELRHDSPVLITECGSLGCPGTGSNTWLPNISPESLKAMLASPQKTINALHTRLVWSGCQQPHFSPRPNMSPITGFDNRQLLPPYLPILRGEDRLFGHLLDYLVPTAITLDYPWAVPHLPIPRRNWQDSDRDFTPEGGFPWFFSEQILVQRSSCLATQPMDRLASLATIFNDLAAATAESLIIRQRDSVLQHTSKQLQHLENLLITAHDAPDAWQAYLEQGIEQLKTGLDQVSRKDFTAKGLPASLQGNELVVFWQDTWSGFANALRAWPDIRAAAAGLIEG